MSAYQIGFMCGMYGCTFGVFMKLHASTEALRGYADGKELALS
jgi:hypothetical protein